jgi:hypothetical protein
MYLDAFAEAFAAVGLGALVSDHRGFGASDGEPLQEIDPWTQVRDYRHAITWAQARPEVDAASAHRTLPVRSGGLGDNPTPARVEQKGSWIRPVLAVPHTAAVDFLDKEQIRAERVDDLVRGSAG